jgi:hypothetical protein
LQHLSITFNKQKKWLLKLLRGVATGYFSFIKLIPKPLMTISAGRTKGMKLRFWLIAMMFFQAGLGSVMETQCLKTQAWMGVGAVVTKRFVFPWYQPNWGWVF